MYFEDMDLVPELLDALYDMGFEEATPVQAQAIPAAIEGKDILAVAQTGTGKTAAFLLPILNRFTEEPNSKVDTIILEPTRELAMQVDRQLEGFSFYTPVSSVAIYGGRGGQEMEMERRALKKGAPIIVATPGRFIAHLDLGYTDLSGVRHLILDEADRMLDMGFVHDIKKIIDMLPKEGRQTLFFSATMPPKIRKFSKDILKDPVEINIAISKPAEKIDQKAYDIIEEGKLRLMERIIKDRKHMERILIFAGTKKGVRDLERTLKRRGHVVGAISSDLEQKEREVRLREFRSGKLPIVVATDVLSRGIHIDGIDLVVNYDVPGDAEDYVHRIGRTARASAEGEAITFISPKDRHRFRKIEDLTEKRIKREELTDGLEVFKPGAGGGDRRGGNRRSNSGGRGRGGSNRSGGGGGHRRGRSGGGGNRRRGGGGNRNSGGNRSSGENRGS
ncbi:MAG: DEAD/DEAH box helicase [Bacteroidota bacterium]